MNNILRILIVSAVIACFCFTLPGCSGGPGGGPWRYDPGIPEQLSGLKAVSGDGMVSLSWSANAKASSYNVYYVSELMATKVTKANGVKLNVTVPTLQVTGLDNNIRYYFMVTAVNRDGEGAESTQVSALPGPINGADLNGTWYFHALVTGPDARWERGSLTMSGGSKTREASAVVSSFEDSSGNTSAPTGFAMAAAGNGEVTLPGDGSAHFPAFHGVMGSAKSMMVATYAPTLQSRAIIIFQKKSDDVVFSTEDIMGTGSGQNPNDPNINGNGPTRFAYHQLSSGAETGWEYANAKVGQHGGVWLDQFKDVIYWDYSAPDYKLTAGLDFFWKVTSFGIDSDGLVSEYWNYTNTIDAVNIPSFNTLTPKKAHDVVFTGRMSADKTVVVGVSTRSDANGANPRYLLRIMELNFKPADQTLHTVTLNNLAGVYRFQKLGSVRGAGGSVTTASAYGEMMITDNGATTFPTYNSSSTKAADGFSLAYYPDPGSDGKQYPDFANFTTAAQDGKSRYFGADGKPRRLYWDFWSSVSNINIPSTWRSISSLSSLGFDPMSTKYFNEHGTLSLLNDLFVLTRTDGDGDCLIVGLK